MSRSAKAPASPAPSTRSRGGGHKGDAGSIVEAKPTTPTTQPSSGAAAPPAPSGTTPAPGTPPRRAVLELMRDVQSGAMDPRNIGPDDRRACVAYLTAEGYTVPEIAQVLKTCDRTVHRDREKTRAENALRPSAGLVMQLVGQLTTEAATAVQRLRRIGRDKDAPHSARVDAERGAWLVYREFVQSMQRLGYLPTAVPSVSAHITHNVSMAPHTNGVPVVDAQGRVIDSAGSISGSPVIDELYAELERLEEVQKALGVHGHAGSDALASMGGAAGAGAGANPGGGMGASVQRARRALLLLEAGHHVESARQAADGIVASEIADRE